MKRGMKLMVAAGLGLAVALTGAGAYAMLQQDIAAQLRASGQAGEQADGYLGVVGNASAQVRAQVDSVNRRRRLRDLRHPHRPGPILPAPRRRLAPAQPRRAGAAACLVRMIELRLERHGLFERFPH
jgi:hypothetical protein